MAIQRNVTQQNDVVLTRIRHTSGILASGGIPWLSHVLLSQGFNPNRGVLVRMASALEQEGDSYGFIWLTSSGQFWEIEAMVSRESGELIEIESLRGVTAEVVVSPHVPGTGKSFGFLAMQVLNEVLGG